MTVIAIAVFVLAGALAGMRLLKGPNLADRVVALDVMLISLMGAISVDAARRDDTTFLVLPIVLAIVGFTATVATTRFIEHEALADRDHESDAQEREQR